MNTNASEILQHLVEMQIEEKLIITTKRNNEMFYQDIRSWGAQVFGCITFKLFHTQEEKKKKTSCRGNTIFCDTVLAFLNIIVPVSFWLAVDAKCNYSVQSYL